MAKNLYKIFDVNNIDVNTNSRTALGNSFVEIIFLTDKHEIETNKTIKAVINDQPNIQISSNWEDSPMTSIGQNISRFLQNPIIDAVAQQSANYKKLTLTDEYSKKFYAGISDISFDISFRLYQDSFFKTTNPISAFKNIMNALLPKNTFEVSKAINNIENAFDVANTAGTKVINGVSNAYTQLSSIIDSSDSSPINILSNLASDINNVISSIARNQALGNSYFLLKIGYDLLGYAYPMEVICSNCSFEFSKQTWYNKTNKKFQPYFIDFNMSFTTLCTPSLKTWKNYINGASNKLLNSITESNIIINNPPTKIDNFDTNMINESVLQYTENKIGITATKENVKTANTTYKLLKDNIINNYKENKYTAKPILTTIQSALKEGTISTELAETMKLTDYNNIFEYDENGKVTIKDKNAANVILNIDPNNGVDINKNETLTNSILGITSYGNSNVSIKNENIENNLDVINGKILTNKQSIPVKFRDGDNL